MSATHLAMTMTLMH